MKWMNLEPIIQSEVSQREKDKYCILMHTHRIEKGDTVCCHFDNGCEMVSYHGFQLLIFTCLDIHKNLEGVSFRFPVLQVSQVQKRQRTFPSLLSKLGQENRN